MRWFFAILAVLAGGAVGYLMRNGKKKRVQILSDLCKLCETLSQNVDYRKEKLSVVVKDLSEKVCKDVQVVLDTLNRSLGESDLEKKMKDACEHIGLKKEESAIVAAMLSSLGRTDSSSQKDILCGYAKQLGETCDAAKEDFRKNAKLYLELGVLLGIGVGIMIL